MRDNSHGKIVTALEYDCYIPMAEKLMTEIAGQIASEFPINRLAMGTGWTIFAALGMPPKPEELPLYLSKAVAAWQKQNPMLTVGATLPIVANGNTIAVHVWFE